MSNDLISRNALLKELNEFCGQQRYLVPENVWNMIENTPIAYNSEKIVEQLEERLCSETDAATNVSCAMRNNHFKEAIEIVKAGGINE